MKKSWPLILLASLVMVGLIAFAVLAPKPKAFDERITLNEEGKNPYGFGLSYSLLPKMFPHALQTKEFESPGYWKSLDNDQSNQALIIAVPKFDPEAYELSTLAAFARNGNYVLITAASYSELAAQYLGINFNFFNLPVDSLSQKPLEPMPFAGSVMSYPGKSIRSSLLKANEIARVHAVDDHGSATLISYQLGKGRIIVQLDPLALSNYYLLYGQNIHYYQALFSLIPSNVSVVAWDKYFLVHRSNKSNEKPESGWLSNLLKYKEFAWALMTALGFFLLFLILRMRRKQREIPEIKKPQNESLQFVQVLGRLYREKGDHHGLALKMALYFKDFVRSRYFINTQVLDESFTQSLHHKSSIPYNEIYSIVYFTNTLETRSMIDAQELIEFHQWLQKFYESA